MIDNPLPTQSIPTTAPPVSFLPDDPVIPDGGTNEAIQTLYPQPLLIL
jgi:hypothetical protein